MRSCEKLNGREYFSLDHFGYQIYLHQCRTDVAELFKELPYHNPGDFEPIVAHDDCYDLEIYRDQKHLIEYLRRQNLSLVAENGLLKEDRLNSERRLKETHASQMLTANSTIAELKEKSHANCFRHASEMRRLILEHGLHRNELEHETQAVTNELEVLRARFVMETEGLRSQVFLQARDLERLGGRVKTLLFALENCEKRINELETDKMNLEKEIADKDMNLYVGLGRYGGRFRGRRRRVSILLI